MKNISSFEQFDDDDDLFIWNDLWMIYMIDEILDEILAKDCL